MFAQMKQFPDKTYDFDATPTSIGGVEFNKNGKPLQKCRLNDGQSEEKATIYQGSGIPLDPAQHIGKPLRFSLSGNNFKDNVYFQGFWRSEVQLPAATEPYQAQPQQAQQPATEPPADFARKESDRVDGMCRTNLICAIIQHGGIEAYNATKEDVIEGIVIHMVKGPVPF